MARRASDNEMASAVASSSSTQPHVNGHIQTTRDYAHVDAVLNKPGPWTSEDFDPGAAKTMLREDCKILVIGAGGLGCEILQNLALLGFQDIHVIDMDTIDISNLNRQFLFRQKDVGRPKADVAAEFVMRRVPGIRVTPYFGKIQDKDAAYYMGFNIIICGLDNIEARRWMNATIVGLADPENPDSYKPLIDGGTEGFRGQSRVILPEISSCYECGIDLLTPPTAFPICTIANTPRLPEHCIEWASVLEWPRVFQDKKLDADDPDHIQWLFDTASARADQHKIEGVTWSLTQGVVKNIIPAIASTNAIIAASCCNEAFKIATSSAPYLDNYMMYVGNKGIYTYTFQLEKKEHCPVCDQSTLEVKFDKTWTLQQLVDHLKDYAELFVTYFSRAESVADAGSSQIKRPSLFAGAKQLYVQSPPQLEQRTRPNLEKELQHLLENGDEVTVTDKSLPFSLHLIVTLT